MLLHSITSSYLVVAARYGRPQAGNTQPRANRTVKAIDERMQPFSSRFACRSVHKNRSRSAQSLIETLLGMVIIIPLGLASVDITAMVVANHINEHLADSAARAAANQLDDRQARTTAQGIVDRFNIAPPINEVNLDNVVYDLNAEQVTVNTSVNVNLPIPFGTNNQVVLRASSTQPIVATPAPM